MTLTDFLLARLSEDEAAVRRNWNGRTGMTDERWSGTPFQPSRVLSECEAKRRIVERAGTECVCTDHGRDRVEGCAQCLACHAVTTADGYVLADLAVPYANHPAYDERWRP